MTTFALVHGAWHTGSCWDPTAALLREAGHTVVAPDLPCDDAGAGLDAYAATVVTALDAVHPADDIVLVGHSLGGLTIPLVAAAVPVRALVFLCALVPLPGASVVDDLYQLDDTFAPEWDELSSHLEMHDDRSTSWPADPDPAAIDALYHDCPPDLAAWASRQLRRQARAPIVEPSPLARYPEVPSIAIVGADDRVLNAGSCARHAAERLGASVVWLDGGHSPMLAQPSALVDALRSTL
ncbi:MAG: alpha/beta fold hydrolase [Microthrixaceae bacterium]